LRRYIPDHELAHFALNSKGIPVLARHTAGNFHTFAAAILTMSWVSLSTSIRGEPPCGKMRGISMFQ